MTQQTNSPTELARLATLLPVGVGMVRDGIWIWANPALAELLGTTPDALIGQGLTDIVAPEDRARVWERYRAGQLGARAPSSYEVIGLRADGRRVGLEFEPQKHADNATVLLVRDLGERVRDSALLGALSELALKVQRGRTIESIAQATTHGLRLLGFASTLFRVEGVTARIIASDFPEVAKPQMDTPLEPLLSARVDAQHLAATTPGLEEGTSRFLDDFTPFLRETFVAAGLEPPPGLGELVRELGIEKVAICPLVVNGRTWGILHAASSTLRSNDAAALALFASQVAMAIEVASSIAGLRRRNDELEAIHRVAMSSTDQPLEALAPALLNIVREATGSDAGALYLLDEENSALVRAGVSGYEEPDQGNPRITLSNPELEELRKMTVSRAISASPAEQGTLARGFPHSAMTPLKVGGRTAGILSLARSDDRTFTCDELRSVEILTAQVATQMERARLHADAQRRLEDLSLMNEVGALIANNLEFDQVLATAIRHAARIADVPNALVLLLSSDRRELELAASNVDSVGDALVRVPLDLASASARSVLEGRPVAIEDVTSDPRASLSLARQFGHRAVLAVPLLSEGRAIGSLLLGDSRTRRFSRSEIDRSVAMANLVAAALDNARLYDQQRRRAEQFRLLLEVGRTITGSLELEPILREAVDALVQMIDATDAFVWIVQGQELCGRLTTAPEHAEEFTSIRLKLTDASAATLAIRQRSPVRIEDALGSPEVNRAVSARFPQQSLLTIPLMLRDVPIGTIGVGDRNRKRRFTDAEVEQGLLIARQVAVAIDNARLFEDLKHSYHELSRAQQELVRRERLAALGELSAIVAHEVRNPLGAIFNSLATLKRSAPAKEEVRQLLGIVGEEAERLNRMVGDLLDFSRPHEVRRRPTALAEVIEGALSAAGRAFSTRALELRTDIPDDLPRATIDAQLIHQALLNLVMNAIQALPNGGTVTIRARLEPRGEPGFVRLEVEDDGPGIPPELADRVFQPFFTTRAAGSGLGLAVVKRIAEAHGAELTLESPPGRGASFVLTLPLQG